VPLQRTPCVYLVGEIPDVTWFYRYADVVVVPVRVGGGTRIKVLEAFAHRRPVVSTSMGIEGIDAYEEMEVLLADEPDAFARQCLRLMTDPALCDRLVHNAFDLLTRAFSKEAVATAAAACAAARSMSETTTREPSRANRRALACPMPDS